jgi:tetratricopeptide (TPR) repeat protein
MKAQKLKFILLAFGTVFLTSCTSLLYTSLDVLHPAKVAFAPDANNLLIVNNTVNQPANYGHRTDMINQSTKNINISTDSTSIFCLGALSEDLEGKDFFSSVSVIPNSVNKNTDFFSTTDLNEKTVKDLCAANHSNVILSLDNIKVSDDLTESYLIDNATFLASLELRFESTWSIHYLNKPEVTKIQFKDTVNWESESYQRKETMKGLPKRADALVDGALTVGHNCVNRFVPYWDKVDRYFFNPKNKLMKQGMDSVYVKNWKSAISSWEKVLNTEKSTTLKAQATNNIAIGYEILGDMDKALEYAMKSLKLFGEQKVIDYDAVLRISNYVTELDQRKDEVPILKKQLGE